MHSERAIYIVTSLLDVFGFDGAEPATFAELANELGMSPEAVRRRVVRELSVSSRPLRLSLHSPHSGERFLLDHDVRRQTI